jgi:hypothetical protein
VCSRATIQAIAAYLDVFQKIADAATSTRGEYIIDLHNAVVLLGNSRNADIFLSVFIGRKLIRGLVIRCISQENRILIPKPGIFTGTRTQYSFISLIVLPLIVGVLMKNGL